MEELWKDTHVFGEAYQVSNFGNVRSKDRYVNSKPGCKRLIKGRMLKPYTTAYGYKMVSLGINMSSKRTFIFVHRLVAIAFIDNPYAKPHVNHIDSNKQNNRVNNLEWCTKSENWIHARKAGFIAPAKRGDSSYYHVITESIAREVKKLLLAGVKPSDAARQLGIRTHHAYHIHYGRAWNHVMI